MLIARPDRTISERLAIRASLPDWLEEILLQELGDNAAAFSGAINVPGPICARVQGIPREQIADARPCALSPIGVVFDERPNLLAMDDYRRGHLEPQDEGSQLLGLL